MEKEDLMPAMVVELRNHLRYVVLDSYAGLYIANEYECIYLTDYNDDMTHPRNNINDIIAVYEVHKKICLDRLLDLKEEELIKQWERDSIDWTKVPVDTKILVKNYGNGCWLRGYFAKYEDEKVYTFAKKQTSWVADEVTSWKYARLADKD